MANREYAVGFSGFKPRYDGNINNHPLVRAARERCAVEDLKEIKNPMEYVLLKYRKIIIENLIKILVKKSRKKDRNFRQKKVKKSLSKTVG